MAKLAIFVFIVIVGVELYRLISYLIEINSRRDENIIKFLVKSENLTKQEKYFCEELLYKDKGKYLNILKQIADAIKSKNPILEFKGSTYFEKVVYTCHSYVEASNIKKLVFYWLKAKGYEDYIAIPKSEWDISDKIHRISVEFHKRPSIEELAKVLEYDPHGTTGEYINRIDFMEPTIYSQTPQYMLHYGNNSTKVITQYELLLWLDGYIKPKL